MAEFRDRIAKATCNGMCEKDVLNTMKMPDVSVNRPLPFAAINELTLYLQDVIDLDQVPTAAVAEESIVLEALKFGRWKESLSDGRWNLVAGRAFVSWTGLLTMHGDWWTEAATGGNTASQPGYCMSVLDSHL